MKLILFIIKGGDYYLLSVQVSLRCWCPQEVSAVQRDSHSAQAPQTKPIPDENEKWLHRRTERSPGAAAGNGLGKGWGSLCRPEANAAPAPAGLGWRGDTLRAQGPSEDAGTLCCHRDSLWEQGWLGDPLQAQGPSAGSGGTGLAQEPSVGTGTLYGHRAGSGTL